MDRETARQTIRARWREIISRMTTPAKQNVNGETSWICPFCGHGKNGDGLTRNPRSADGNGLKCFACGFAGDIIDLYRGTTGKEYGEALFALAGLCGLSIDTAAESPAGGRQEPHKGAQKSQADNTLLAEKPKEPLTPAPDFSEYLAVCRERLSDPAAVAYLNSRGISLETAQRAGIGFDPEADPAGAPGAMPGEHKPHPCPRIIAPCGPGFYVNRRIDGDAYKAINPKGGRPFPFNFGAIYAHEAREVYITEGFFDALAIMETGREAVALNSASNTEAFAMLLKERRPDAVLILCLDNDSAGKAGTAKLLNELDEMRLDFITAEICGEHKDPAEALAASPESREAFYMALEDAEQAARAKREIAERERQRRTGPGMVDSFLQAIQTRKYEPIETGITDLDKATGGGFFRQSLVLLGAAPGAGKTALAQWIFEGMAEQGTACLFINLEMSRDQLLSRSLARMAAKDGRTIKPTEILKGYAWTPEQRETVIAAADKYKAEIAPRMTYNPDGMTSDLDFILEYADREAARAEAAGDPAPLLVLDYLQVITGQPGEDKTDLIRRAITRLKNDYAIRHNSVVFTIMAQNREANRKGRSSMESGRDTSSIEYGADLLLGLDFTECLTRPGKDGKSVEELTQDEKKLKTLRIHKNRFGEAGAAVDLYFNGETMSFSQIAKF